MPRSRNKTRDSVRETLARFVEMGDDVAEFSVHLKTLVDKARKATDRRRGIYDPNARLLMDATDAIARIQGGLGLCRTLVRRIDSEVREESITPKQRQAATAEARARVANEIKLAEQKRFRERAGLPEPEPVEAA